MWSWVTRQPLAKLDKPPVVEVICGLCFPPLDIDPVVAGAYWSERKDDYPRRQVHPAIERGPGVVVAAVPRMRVWLLSQDESQLIQLQSDRFYLNWRRVGSSAAYPRFSGDAGLCARSTQEFERFGGFCKRVLGQQPATDRVELGKVDHLDEGQFWNGVSDLATMIPALAPSLYMAAGTGADVALRFQEQVGAMQLKLAIDSTLTMAPGRAPVRGVRIDTTVSVPLDGRTPTQCFSEANEIINSLFAVLIPESERTRRFMNKGHDR
jgi:uncharacterized protein (TIGR04255 family)